ncbi:MAG: OmpH family outer membrane protein [Bacteroidota bacterium]|nr:OmpH family outer membrane protein [Bacteroidota bacterium]
MKNGLLIWNVVLSLLVGFLLVMQFGAKKGKASGSAKSGGDSTDTNSEFRMAYFEMDSIAANFNLVKDLKTEMSNKEAAITAEIENRTKALQQKFNFYQNKAQAGNLSQEQSDAASKEMKDMDDEMKSRKQQLDQDYNNYVMTKQTEIKTKIEDFLKEYNNSKDYSYIVSYEQGLFYFRDTAYNITADVVKGLNEKFRPVKKN